MLTVWLMLVCVVLAVVLVLWWLQGVLLVKSPSDESLVKTPRFSPLFITLLLGIMCLAMVLYYVLGSSLEWSSWQRFQAMQAQGVFSSEGLMRWMKVLKVRTHEHPDDAKAWLILGKLQLAKQRYTEATQALDHALRLVPNNRDVQVMWIEAQFYAQSQRLNGKAYELAMNIDKQGDDGGVILTLLALDAEHKQQPGQAIQYWQRLLLRVSPDSKSYQSIKQAIVRDRSIVVQNRAHMKTTNRVRAKTN